MSGGTDWVVEVVNESEWNENVRKMTVAPSILVDELKTRAIGHASFLTPQRAVLTWCATGQVLREEARLMDLIPATEATSNWVLKLELRYELASHTLVFAGHNWTRMANRRMSIALWKQNAFATLFGEQSGVFVGEYHMEQQEDDDPNSTARARSIVDEQLSINHITQGRLYVKRSAFIRRHPLPGRHAYFEYSQAVEKHLGEETGAMRQARQTVENGRPDEIQAACFKYLELAASLPFRFVTWVEQPSKKKVPWVGVSLSRGIITVDPKTRSVLSTKPIDSLLNPVFRAYALHTNWVLFLMAARRMRISSDIIRLLRAYVGPHLCL